MIPCSSQDLEKFLYLQFWVFQAVIVRPLSAVSSLVRFAEEPQMFAVEFSDGCPIHVSILYDFMSVLV